MTPEVAVARLAEIIAARAEFTEDDIYAAMAEVGIPAPFADRAYKFTQIAWGRLLLDGLGVQSSPDYFCFNGVGEVVESGLLAEQPYFVAAMHLAKECARTPGFRRFALMSSDVNAVNSALKAGSKPENLVMAPAALFLEPAAPDGMDRARKLLTQHLRGMGKARGSQKSAPVNKPWWRFW